jgi:hypothetical protein
MRRIALPWILVLVTLLGGCSSGTLGRVAQDNALPQDLDKDLVRKFEIQDASTPAPTPLPTPSPTPTEKPSKKKKKTPKAAPAPAPTPTPTLAPFAYPSRRPAKDPIWVGEKHVFDVTYFGMSAGDLSMEALPYKIVNERKVYHIRATAVSSSVFNLFYRLNVLPIQLPPLRERKNDIEVLAKYFIDKFNQQHGKQITRLSAESMDLLKGHAWPGNIRELENVIEHAFVIESSNEITPESLPETVRNSGHGASPGLTTLLSDESDAGDADFDLGGLGAEDADGDEAPLEPAILRAAGASLASAGFKLDINRLDFQANKEEFERQFLISALKAFKGRINQTALHANIPKKTLLRKLQKYGISAKEYNS